MTLITCDCNCLYQKDGYCYLETPTSANNMLAEKGCVHYVCSSSQKNTASEQTKPQTLA